MGVSHVLNPLFSHLFFTILQGTELTCVSVIALHFKLAIDVDPEEGETHCHYTPQLDSSRDRALIAILPGYLVDEISFPQSQAGKFYARVLKALNEAAEV
jgi:hypothetical protein